MRSRLAYAVAVLVTAALPAVCAGDTSTIVLPQEVEIQMALEAGPEHIRRDAAVYVFGEQGYEQIRDGGNGFTCLVNRDGNQHGDNDLKPTCWDPEGSRTIVPVMLRVGELLARSASAQQIERDIDSGFASGKFVSPQKTGIAYMLKGDVGFDPKAQRLTNTVFPPHYMIYSPGVSNADIGMNVDNPKSEFSLPRVFAGYSGGARTAYIIVMAARQGEHPH